MSAAPRFPAGGYAGLRMTAEEFFSLGQTSERYELIDGVVVMSPSPLPSHNELLAEIVFQLKAYAKGKPGVRVFPETDIRFSRGLVYRPDIAIYAPGKLGDAVERLETPPDLIVELLSPATKAADLVTKRDDYEKFGVAEYWAIDPADARVRAWSRRGARLVERPVENDSIASQALPGFTLDIRPLAAMAGRAKPGQ